MASWYRKRKVEGILTLSVLFFVPLPLPQWSLDHMASPTCPFTCSFSNDCVASHDSFFSPNIPDLLCSIFKFSYFY